MIKSKARQFKPTHLKLQLIMKMEIVMRARAVCVCRSRSGLRNMFCNLNRQPRVGINILRLAVDQREMFILQRVMR